MSFESIRLITFDCYGTLIDWENGMLAALRPLLSRDGRKVPDTRILELYGDVEAELESGPYLPYRQVLAQAAKEVRNQTHHYHGHPPPTPGSNS